MKRSQSYENYLIKKAVLKHVKRDITQSFMQICPFPFEDFDFYFEMFFDDVCKEYIHYRLTFDKPLHRQDRYFDETCFEYEIHCLGVLLEYMKPIILLSFSPAFHYNRSFVERHLKLHL